MPRLHGYPAAAAELVPFETPIAQRALPAARIGRSALGAGGLLARVWIRLRLPRVERFRFCARCGLTRDEDRARKVRGIEASGSTYCPTTGACRR